MLSMIRTTIMTRTLRVVGMVAALWMMMMMVVVMMARIMIRMQIEIGAMVPQLPHTHMHACKHTYLHTSQ